MNCIRCDRNIQTSWTFERDLKNDDMCEANVFTIRFGGFSIHDGQSYAIGVCDDCIQVATNYGSAIHLISHFQTAPIEKRQPVYEGDMQIIDALDCKFYGPLSKAKRAIKEQFAVLAAIALYADWAIPQRKISYCLMLDENRLASSTIRAAKIAITRHFRSYFNDNTFDLFEKCRGNGNDRLHAIKAVYQNDLREYILFHEWTPYLIPGFKPDYSNNG